MYILCDWTATAAASYAADGTYVRFSGAFSGALSCSARRNAIIIAPVAVDRGTGVQNAGVNTT
jgi:hypothetical protein